MGNKGEGSEGKGGGVREGRRGGELKEEVER